MKQPLLGGAYQARSLAAAAQRSVNLFAEPVPENAGEPMPVAHYPTPGLRILGTLPQGPVRGLRQATTGGVYAVAGSGVYLVSTADWSATHLGDITALRPYPVSMADNGETLVIVDGTAGGWTVDLATHAFAQIPAIQDATPAHLTSGAISSAGVLATLVGISNGAFAITINGSALNLAPIDFTAIGNLGDAAALITAELGGHGACAWDGTAGHFTITSAVTGAVSIITYADKPASGSDISVILRLSAASGASAPVNGGDPQAFSGADRVDYLDTRFLFNKPGTPQFYASRSNATTFDPLDFANKQSYGDLLVTLCVAKREIWLLGERTTEIWTDVGAADFPYQQIGGVFVDRGCAAKYSVASHDNTVYWLARDRAGQGIVFSGVGYQTQRISTYAIEAEFTTYPRLSDAIGFVYSLGGHVFYVLTFPHADKTWVYDMTTGVWHEWLWIDDNGREHRHRANCAYAVDDLVVVGDHANGNLYHVDATAFTDAGQPIVRIRSFPHVVNEMDRVFYRQFIADVECGNPVETA